ncbi:MAG: Maf family protein [Candidatus Izimaplasma sp.]|nr:Maf family protein [Candidatus Izimaplasma bacterium]
MYLDKQLILASQSPRRKELLDQLELSFEVIPSAIEEHLDSDKSLAENVMSLAEQKALDIYQKHPNKIILGFDTLVTFNGNILGKPTNNEEAFSMLKTLSGTTHEVFTGCAVITKEKRRSFYGLAKVTFAHLSTDEINDYIASKEPMDKAGAYAIQGKAAKFVKHVEGDYYAIIGVPIYQLYNTLKTL